MNTRTSKGSSGFHEHIDRSWIDRSWDGNIEAAHPEQGSWVTTQEREVSFQFYPHFHPYAEELRNRLIDRSVTGLQAIDTEYSTPVILSHLVNATLAADGTTDCPLSSGEELILPDGTLIELPGDGTQLKLSYHRLVNIDDHTTRMLESNTVIKLPQNTFVICADGRQVLLADEAEAVLPDGKPRPALYEEIFSKTCYDPSDLVEAEFYPVKDLDFSPKGAYAIYNWELFYHVPFTIGIHLSKNQRFEEAQRWFHLTFDPTDDSAGSTPERFWKVKPFQTSDVRQIEEILINLATGEDPKLQQDTIDSIGAWKDAPFRPHVIARYRQTAYMYKTVMAYLDNLIAWGDSLFRQDTGESINEAAQLYVMAANILGPRPQAVPKKGSVRPQTYANLKQDLDKFGNALRELETGIPFDIVSHPTGASDSDSLNPLRSLGASLYFCVPRNDKLVGYWDTVADRLFKLRNSLNIQGIFRQLALFEPPIDPAMLARATAAGLDVDAIVNGLNQPLPLVRFQLLAQKAAEIAQEVRSLGNSLLSAIEKEDGEALAILRAKHERVVMEMVEDVKIGQMHEAMKSKEGLEISLKSAIQRYTFYELQLGKTPDEITKGIPELGDLEGNLLAKSKIKEPELPPREITVDIARDLNESGGQLVSSHEEQEMAKLKEARDKLDSAASLDKIGGGLALIPSFGTHFEPFGTGGSLSFGGSHLSAAMSLWSSFDKTKADKKTFESGRTAKTGSYARREQNWAFESGLAAAEITRIFKQIRAAEIRQAIAELELTNHQQQIKNAQETEFFLTGEKIPSWTQRIDPKEKKTTNKALYTWMKREVRGLHAECFQFAFDVAKKAERALQHELGDSSLSYLQFGYLAGKEGLLAGEKLHLDLKRMEMAYHEKNQREYELTKHVSLRQVDPVALIQLRETGRCTVALPEELFDMDGPGHYFRRIKSVALSIPCVTGPYSSVNCTLTLQKSSIRKSANLADDDYSRAEDGEDSRFSDYYGSLQSIVTSSGQNDSGLFETNLHDERYLPFEYSGVISEWQLQLPADPSGDEPCQFDYDTISDVILHIRYTAREGGAPLRNGAIEHLTNKIEAAQAAGSVRLFSVRHEFPNAWTQFKGETIPATLTLDLKEDHYPFRSQGRLGTQAKVALLAKFDGTAPPNISCTPFQGTPLLTEFKLVKDTTLGDLLVGQLNKDEYLRPDDQVSFEVGNNSMEDLWFAVSWGGKRVSSA